MAQFRQDMEEWTLANVACYAEHGVEVSMASAGGISLPSFDSNDTATASLLMAAMDACTEQVGFFGMWHDVFDEAAYQRVLDSRDCLIVHGWEVSAPPSFEVWAEADGLWFPHGEVYDNREPQSGRPRWTAAEWAELNKACPQPGPRTFDVSGLPE